MLLYVVTKHTAKKIPQQTSERAPKYEKTCIFVVCGTQLPAECQQRCPARSRTHTCTDRQAGSRHIYSRRAKLSLVMRRGRPRCCCCWLRLTLRLFVSLRRRCSRRRCCSPRLVSLSFSLLCVAVAAAAAAVAAAASFCSASYTNQLSVRIQLESS